MLLILKNAVVQKRNVPFCFIYPFIPLILNCLSTYYLLRILITAAVGTANNIPQTPKKPPPISMEILSRKALSLLVYQGF